MFELGLPTAPEGALEIFSHFQKRKNFENRSTRSRVMPNSVFPDVYRSFGGGKRRSNDRQTRYHRSFASGGPIFKILTFLEMARDFNGTSWSRPKP